jgi:hypothetical protein
VREEGCFEVSQLLPMTEFEAEAGSASQLVFKIDKKALNGIQDSKSINSSYHSSPTPANLLLSQAHVNQLRRNLRFTRSTRFSLRSRVFLGFSALFLSPHAFPSITWRRENCVALSLTEATGEKSRKTWSCLVPSTLSEQKNGENN